MASKDEVLEAMARASCEEQGIDPNRVMAANRNMTEVAIPNWYNARADLLAALRAADAIGWRMVPFEATPEMIAAGHVSDPLGCDVEEEHAEAVYTREWRAMLSASPSLIEE